MKTLIRATHTVGGSLIGRMQLSALKIHLQMLFLLRAHWSLSESGKTGGQVIFRTIERPV